LRIENRREGGRKGGREGKTNLHVAEKLCHCPIPQQPPCLEVLLFLLL
jgi:hypothetical protein